MNLLFNFIKNLKNNKSLKPENDNFWVNVKILKHKENKRYFLPFYLIDDVIKKAEYFPN